MEDLVLTIPTQDGAFIETLAQRMGWTMRRRTIFSLIGRRDLMADVTT
jgi:hypothetical protein